jgi:hypothetical protein
VIISGGLKLSGGWKQDANRGGLIHRSFDPGPGSAYSGQDNKDGYWNAFNPQTWELTINSATQAPTCVYLTSNLDPYTGDWPELFRSASGAMTLQTGTPIYDIYSPFGGENGDDVGVSGDGDGYWNTAGTSFGNVGNEIDIVYEVLFQFVDSGGTNQLFMCKDTPSSPGWLVGVAESLGDELVFQLYASGALYISSNVGPLVDGAVYHAVCAINRDENSTNSARWWVNTIQTGAGTLNLYPQRGDTSNSDKLTLLSRTNGTLPCVSTIFSQALWLRSNWHKAGAAMKTEMSEVAKELYHRRMGTLAKLSPSGSNVPTLARTTNKYYHRYDQGVLHLAPAGMLIVDDYGMHIEGDAENICKQSQTLDNATWAKWNCSVGANAAAAPDGTITADAIEEDGYNTWKRIIQGNITLATDTKYVYSIYAKKATRDYVAILFYDAVGPGTLGSVYFNLADGVKGTEATAPDDCGIIDLDNGWYRLWMTVTTVNSGEHRAYIFSANTDNDIDYQGVLDQEAIYAWGAQVELGTYPSSYIPTVASTETRNADDVDLDSDVAVALNTAGQGTIECEFMLPDIETLLAQSRIADLSSGSAILRMVLYVHTDGRLRAYVRSVEGTQADFATGAVSCADGEWHTASLSWRTDYISLICDGAETVDTEAIVPVGFTELAIGKNYDDSLYFNGGWIRKLRLFDKAKR